MDRYLTDRDVWEISPEIQASKLNCGEDVLAIRWADDEIYDWMSDIYLPETPHMRLSGKMMSPWG